MHFSFTKVIIFIPFFFLPWYSIFSPPIFISATNGSSPLIGFTWINSPLGASELTDAGYQKALEIGAQIEHRDFSWGYLNYSLKPINEWHSLYLEKYEKLNSSITVGVITSNLTLFPNEMNFTRYLSVPLSEGYVRFNDSVVVTNLEKMIDFLLNRTKPFSYISFGDEINGFFETYFNYSSLTFTNTIMLRDYVDLCEKLYNYVHLAYPETRVLTIFRNQLESDSKNIQPLIGYFENACDVYGMSCRIFTNDLGYLPNLNEAEIINRFSSFIDLAGSKKVAITNTFMISDSMAGSSDANQVLHVKSLFKLIRDYSDQLEFVCWYRLYDFPPGYLQAFYSATLEAQRTSGLLTPTGDYKLSYYQWITEMRVLNRIIDYFASWRVAIYALVLVAIAGFLVYVIVMEGLEKRKKSLKELPMEITFSDSLNNKDKLDEEKNSLNEVKK